MKKTTKKILFMSGVILAVLMPLFCFSNATFAEGSGTSGAASGAGTTAAVSGGDMFLGLRPWHFGLAKDAEGNIMSPSQDGIGTFIATIVLNIVTDLISIAGILVTGYIIYGGYLYMFSEGDTGKVAKGKGAIKTATIGAIIVTSASIIFNTISAILLSGSSVAPNDLPKINANSVISSMITWALTLGGLVSVAFIVYGGVCYMTASGDAGKLAKAKNAIKYSLIGLIIVALASVITAFIFSAINNAQS